MWESLKYVNNEWALYAVITISILLVLGSWLRRTERLIERIPETDRSSIIKLEFFGNFLFKILLLSAIVAGFIALLPVLQKNIASSIEEAMETKKDIEELKNECPKKYSDNLNASVNCIMGEKP